MHMHRLKMTIFTLGGFLACGSPALPADLPQSGTIKLHSSFKQDNHFVDVGDKHLMGSGTLWGVTYNDAGSGPLHMGALYCGYAFDVEGGTRTAGLCAFGNPGGADKIFVEFTGRGADTSADEGTGTITGGIGKFAGIRGKMAWQCQIVDPAQALTACTQQFDYELTSVAATR
jgi:hypothetical protein